MSSHQVNAAVQAQKQLGCIYLIAIVLVIFSVGWCCGLGFDTINDWLGK